MYDNIQISFKVTNSNSNDSSQHNSANHLVAVGACLHNALKHLKRSQLPFFSTEFMQQNETYFYNFDFMNSCMPILLFHKNHSIGIS